MTPVLIHHEFDWSQTVPSRAVIDSIAALENVDPIQLDLVLYEYIDPTALDEVVGTDAPVSVSFSTDDYRVRIDGDVLTIHDE